MVNRVIVELQIQSNPAHDDPNPEPIPARRIILEEDGDFVAPIGRGSKNGGPGLEPARDNALFSSRVMSRDHAHLTADWEEEKLYLVDTDSMHGTFVNAMRIPPNEPRLLRNKDIVRFGTEISRGKDFFSPLDATVTYKWTDGCALNPVSSYLAPLTTNSFSVPGASDDEYDNDDEVQYIDSIARSSRYQAHFSPAPSDLSSGGGVPSSYVSEEDEDFEFNTSPPSSPAGLTDEEKAADLASVKAGKSASNSNLDVQPLEYPLMDTTPINDECDGDGMTESGEDTDDEDLYGEPRRTDKPTPKDPQEVRQPSPSDAAMPRAVHMNNGFPPESPRHGYQSWFAPPPLPLSTRSFTSPQESCCGKLPGFSSIDVGWNNSVRTSERQIQETQMPAIFQPAPLRKPFENFSAPAPQMGYQSHSWGRPFTLAPQARDLDPKDVSNPSSSYLESSKSLKRKADWISTEAEDDEEEHVEADVEEITAYTFYHPVEDKFTGLTEEAPPLETVESTKEDEMAIDLSLPSPTIIFHGDREIEKAPPRKRVKITRAAAMKPRSEPGLGRFLATALAGVAVGAIGAVWGLVSLPDDFFA